MLIPLGPLSADGCELLTGPSVGSKPKPNIERFTCRHFADGNCQIYENRPAMCRKYPYNRICEYADCTMKDPYNDA